MRRLLVLAIVLSSAGLLFPAEAHSSDCARAFAPHAYTVGGSGSVFAPVASEPSSVEVAGRDATDGGGRDLRARSVTTARGTLAVSDMNVGDCDGDGVGYDADGDQELGVGGAFFGWGAWADEPTCHYGLSKHGRTVLVADTVFGDRIAFVTAADDVGGPILLPDGQEGTVCETDGSIHPGDPTQDPAADPDDCMSVTYYAGPGTACGEGGDGGFWVLLETAHVTVTEQLIGVENSPTVGWIWAY